MLLETGERVKRNMSSEDITGESYVDATLVALLLDTNTPHPSRSRVLAGLEELLND